MFAIPFNFPFRKSNGDMSTIGAEINGGGGGGESYTLPTASPTTKGGVKIGEGLSMDGEILNNSNPTPYSLPTADADTIGGVKVGTGLSIDENGVLSTSGGGGVTIKTKQASVSGVGSIPANSFVRYELQINELYDKTILGAYTSMASVGVCLARLSDWQDKKLIDLMLFNGDSSATTPSNVYIIYVD